MRRRGSDEFGAASGAHNGTRICIGIGVRRRRLNIEIAIFRHLPFFQARFKLLSATGPLQ
jgi:hypothetical protein